MISQARSKTCVSFDISEKSEYYLLGYDWWLFLKVCSIMHHLNEWLILMTMILFYKLICKWHLSFEFILSQRFLYSLWIIFIVSIFHEDLKICVTFWLELRRRTRYENDFISANFIFLSLLKKRRRKIYLYISQISSI